MDSSIREVVGLAAIYIMLLSIAAVMVWIIFRPLGNAPVLPINWRLFITGISVSIPGPILFLTINKWLEQNRNIINPFLIYGGLMSFAIGWVLIGASLRPRQSVGKGAALAASLYILIGAAWVVAFNFRLSGSEILHPNNLRFVPVLGLMWPLQVAQVLGLFGLTFA